MNHTNNGGGPRAFGGASRERLEELHRRLAECLLELLTSGEDIKPSFLAVARAFLADNGITVDSLHDAHSGMSSLVTKLEALGDFDDDADIDFSAYPHD